jgi:hypothetical protein
MRLKEDKPVLVSGSTGWNISGLRGGPAIWPGGRIKLLGGEEMRGVLVRVSALGQAAEEQREYCEPSGDRGVGASCGVWAAVGVRLIEPLSHVFGLKNAIVGADLRDRRPLFRSTI